MKLLFLLITICSVAAGACFLRSYDTDTLQQFSALMDSYLLQRQSDGVVENFMQLLFPNLIMLLVAFFCGFCAIAAPVLFFIPAFKGLGFGLSVGTLLAGYQQQAFLYVVVFMLPYMLISSYILMAACSRAVRLSCQCFRSITNLAVTSPKQEIKPFCIAFLCYFVLLTVFALLDACILQLFGGIISIV